jgi:hypothetical protein
MEKLSIEERLVKLLKHVDQSKYLQDHERLKKNKNLRQLFTRILTLLLELKDIEEEYMKLRDTLFNNFDIFSNFTEINDEALYNFYEIYVNNQEKLYAFKKSDIRHGASADLYKDNSRISVVPFFGKAENNIRKNIIKGAEFKTYSQMGYCIIQTEVDIKKLKESYVNLKNIIERTENLQCKITVLGYEKLIVFYSSKGFDYIRDVEYDGDKFYIDEFRPTNLEERTKILWKEYGISKKYRVVTVEHNSYGDETWHVINTKI